MLREALYNRTVSILKDGYFDDTLEHGSPCGCAIGNLIAANTGLKLIKSDGWEKVICEKRVQIKCTHENNDNPVINEFSKNSLWFYFRKDKWLKSAKAIQVIIDKQVIATGYTWEELMRIEKAFENVPLWEDNDF